MGLNPGISRIISHRSKDQAKGDTHQQQLNSRDGYEPTTVPVTLGRGVFPLKGHNKANTNDQLNLASSRGTKTRVCARTLKMING